MKKFVTLTVGENEYRLRFGINEMIKLEEATGKNISDLKGESMAEIRALVYAGIKPERTIEDTGDFIDEAIEEIGLDGLMEKLNEAMTLAFGKKQGEKKKDPLK